MTKRQKTHQLIVTVTHDAPVSQREAVKMFWYAYCESGEWAGYHGDVWRDEINDSLDVEASFKSVKAYKP
jgi:GH25 family lysozyme M1 (1,4-beta-N-acetylmuramidase)